MTIRLLVWSVPWLLLMLLSRTVSSEEATSVAWTRAHRESQQEQSWSTECPLVCANGVTCQFAEASFDEHPRYNNGSPLNFLNTTGFATHCACPRGWTGLTCDVPFETCDGNNNGEEDSYSSGSSGSSSTSRVAHHCYHGGRCIPGLLDQFGNDQLFCDCTEAVDSRGNRYVGKFCEHLVTPTCKTPDLDSTLDGTESIERYCVNNGSCNPNVLFEGEPACLCDDVYAGEHCEFEVNSVPECDRRCQNGGICTYGPKYNPSDDSNYWSQDPNNFFSCQCVGGFDGHNCEIVKTPCGDQDFCYFGSECVTRTQRDGPSGDIMTTHACDCSTAQSNVAGRFCQYPATSVCQEANAMTAATFCVNDGICPMNPSDNCECPLGFKGFSCEFVSFAESPNTAAVDSIRQPADPSYAVDCLLECFNGGTCRKGSKENGEVMTALIHDYTDNSTDLMATHSANYEHCVCPSNFTGLQCITPVETCEDVDGDNSPDHFCFNGGKCTRTNPYDQSNNNVSHERMPGCDCSTASGAGRPATGTACQHEASTICNIGSKEIGQVLSFCVNGGTCISYVEPGESHEGCSCPDGWTGDHCELSDKSKDGAYYTSVVESEDEGIDPVGLSMLVVALIVVILAGSALICHLRRSGTEREHTMIKSLKWGSGYKDQDISAQVNTNINLAPRRSSVAIRSAAPRDPIREENEYMDAIMKTSRQSPPRPSSGPNLMKNSQMTPLRHSGMTALSRTSPARPPEIYIGPPRDEDGHELHSVNII